MKGETMSTQAAQFAATFERLGRRMLAQLESFPEELWDRAPLIHHSDSLLTLATRLLDESDHWVLVVVGGREMGGERSLEASSPDVRATLLQRYERWVTQMHRVLGHLPDAIMNLFVAVPPAYRETFGAEESITVRACLLYALEQSGLLVGRIESLGQVLAERQSLRHEVIAAREIDSWPDLRERDARETTNGGRADDAACESGAPVEAPAGYATWTARCLARVPVSGPGLALW
jgi:hypothetical protein